MLKRTAVLLKTESEVIALSFARMADALGLYTAVGYALRKEHYDMIRPMDRP